MAEHGLVQGLDLPPRLFADMGGSPAAVQAVLATRGVPGRWPTTVEPGLRAVR